MNDSTEDIDALMETMAEAISQSEREAAAAKADASRDAPEMREMREARDAEQEAAAMRRTNNLLHAMRSPGGEHTGDFSREDYGR